MYKIYCEIYTKSLPIPGFVYAYTKDCPAPICIPNIASHLDSECGSGGENDKSGDPTQWDNYIRRLTSQLYPGKPSQPKRKDTASTGEPAALSQQNKYNQISTESKYEFSSINMNKYLVSK